MKKLIFLFVTALPVCAHAQMDLKKVSWLNAKWKMENVSPGRQGYESWVRSSENELTGKGIQMKGADTVFVEKLKIIQENGDLFYVADVPGNKGLVYFKFTSLTDSGFTCENPQHDFPKKITYELRDSRLQATISGNGKSIDYFFRKEN